MELQYIIQVVILELICVGILLFNRQAIFENRNKNNSNYFLLWLFLTCFCTWFAVGADYTSYQEALHFSTHVEPFYVSLYNIVGGNYILWRMIVWGIANIFTVLTIKRMGDDVNLFTILFILLPLLGFYYVTRNVLGLSILFYALAYFDYKNIWSWIFVAAAIVFTPEFHNSMMLYSIILMAVLLVPFNRYTLLASFILFPIVQPIVLNLSESVLLELENENMAEMGMNYIEAEHEQLKYTGMGLLDRILQIVPMSLIMIYSIWRYVVCREDDITDKARRFLFMAYILIYISILYLGQGSVYLSTRFWDTAYIPVAFFLSNTLYNHRTKFVVRLFFILALLHFAMDLLSSLREVQ